MFVPFIKVVRLYLFRDKFIFLMSTPWRDPLTFCHILWNVFDLNYILWYFWCGIETGYISWILKDLKIIIYWWSKILFRCLWLILYNMIKLIFLEKHTTRKYIVKQIIEKENVPGKRWKEDPPKSCKKDNIKIIPIFGHSLLSKM